MKQKYTIGFIALVLTIVLAGCVHDYPSMTEDGEEGIDPTLVEVNTEVTLDLELVPLEIITQQNARSGTTKARAGEQTDYRRRFIIEAWREGKPTARQVTVMETAEEENGDGKISLPIRLKLHALAYTLAVWTDYVKAGTTDDLYYDTKDLQYVACRAPYTGSTPYRDCLYGTTPLDLRQYRDEWNANIQVKVDMVRPLAKYELIATDVQKFLQKTQKQRAGSTAYTITVSYGFYFPLGFNVLTRQTRAFGNGCGVYRSACRHGQRQRRVYARIGLHLRERRGIVCSVEHRNQGRRRQRHQPHHRHRRALPPRPPHYRAGALPDQPLRHGHRYRPRF